jgi:ABC-2 type transport system permease protein
MEIIMLKHILKHDWRLLVADKVLWLASLLILFCVSYAVYNGATRAARWRNDVSQQLAKAQEGLLEQKTIVENIFSGKKSAAEYPWTGFPQNAQQAATLPPGPLAAFSVGQSDLYPYATSISLWKRDDNVFAKYQVESPLSLLAGRFDFAFVIVYLLPLLIIALSYNLLSSEKENGTLVLALSQPLSLRTLMIGKVLLRLSLVLGLVVALCVLGFFASGMRFNAPGMLGRFSLWVIVAAAYAMFWFVLAAGVNALGRSSETNATAFTCLWLVFVLILPALLNLAVSAASPVPSRMQYVSSLRAAENAASQIANKLLASYYSDHPDLSANGAAAVPEWARKYYLVQREIEDQTTSILTDYESRLDRQQALVQKFRFLSPAIIAQEALNEIAGAGLTRQRRFVAQTREFLVAWQTQLSPKLFAGARLQPAEYDALPRFGFDEEKFGEVAARVLLGVFALLVITAALFGWSVSALRRYSPAN